MKTVAEYKFFIIMREQRKLGRKTSVYHIVNRRSDTTIGIIEWYVPWRQYCFMPLPSTVWNNGCLADIQKFLEGLKK